MRPIGGWLPDPPDARDYRFGRERPSALLGASARVVIPEVAPIRDQGPLLSCVAFATCAALELAHADGQRLSELAVYWHARLAHEAEGVDGGTYVRAAFASLAPLGVPSSESWPYVHERVNVRPSIDAYVDAHDHRTEAYYRIDNGDLDSVRSAIRLGRGVVFGVEVDSAFVQLGDGVAEPPASHAVLGAHAMCAVGFDASIGAFLVRNSWGTDWGVGGYGWISDSYMRTARDLWTATAA
jgi:C1A family cysteine protease